MTEPFVMPRPLPPIPPTLRGMEEQHAEFRQRARLGAGPVEGRPYDWQRDGL